MRQGAGGKPYGVQGTTSRCRPASAVMVLPPEFHDPQAVLVDSGPARLVQAFLGGRRSHTLRAYGSDLEAFRTFLGVATVEDAARALLSRGAGPANEIALTYRNTLTDKGLSSATVNRRLAALRSLTKLARRIGLVPWALDVEGEKAAPYRDTKGPGREGFLRLLMAVEGKQGPKALRDRVILRLGYDLALRRGEVAGLDLEHVDLDAGTLSILGKGRTAREPVTLPPVTREALTAWIEARGSTPGPLFRNFDHARKGERLTGTSINRMVQALGKQAGVRISFHGLRHASITRALDLSGGDVRAVQRHSRHRDVRTIYLYDDNREDLGGEVARLVAEDARGG